MPRETHRHTNFSMSKIAGMTIVAERPHNKYGSAILIQDYLKVDNVYERVQGRDELITIVMPGVIVHSVYKLTNDNGAHCCKVMYFWCFGFRGELGFLNCDDVCMCVVN